MPAHVEYGTLGRKTLKRWMANASLSQEAVAALLSDAVGRPVSASQVNEWAQGRSHLPLDVVPHLAAIARPQDWTSAILRAIETAADDDVTEDLVPLPARAMRTVREFSDVVGHVASALEDDGDFDVDELRRLVVQLREGLAAGELLLKAAEERLAVRSVGSRS